MAPKKSADNCKPCSDRKKACNGQSPAPTCLRSAAGQAEYEKKHGAGSAIAAIEAWNVQRAQDGKEQVALPKGASGNNHPQIPPIITEQIPTLPSTQTPDIGDKFSDLEEMQKPLPFFDEISGTCELCQEPPAAHTFWCERNPMKQQE